MAQEGYQSAHQLAKELKRNSFVRMIQVIGKNTDLDLVDSSYVVINLCKYSHTSPRDPVKFTWENIDALRREAQERRDQALIDSLKAIEDVIHLKPGHAIEEGREAFYEFKEAYEGYRIAQMMEGYLERGEYEHRGNSVFLGGN